MAGESRTRNKPVETPSGPFEAVVVGHLDPKYMGTLQVELLKTSDVRNDPERSGQLVEAKYLSPFYGVTPQGGSSGNSGYQNTQKSYGMWMIPPDIGTRVLVVFAEGNLSKGYWIGCVQDEFMNFMIPGMAATTQLEDYGKKAPTGEYNKRREKTGQKNPTKFAKPVHIDLAKTLIQQGLIDDDVRGISSSSARREIPSAVFGISTPGPLDKRIDAPKFQRGVTGAKSNVFVSRLGGSMFVMDDGDDKILRRGHAKDSPSEYENIEAITDGTLHNGDVTLPANELLRLKTRTGHQILLHNTEDLIYIGNARGTSWIEMTSNGKIDIYAQDSISIHSSNDLNFTADRDVNFTAGENVNFMVGKDFKTTAGDGIHNTAGLNINNTAGQAISEIAGTHISNYAQMDASYQSIGNTVIGVGKDLEISAGNNSLIEAGYSTHIKSGNHSKFEVEGDLEFSTANLNIGTGEVNWDSSTVSWDANKFILYTLGQISFESAYTYFNSRGETEITTGGDFYQIIDGRYGVRVDGEIKFQSESDDIQLRADSNILTWSGGETNMLVQGGWNVDCNEAAALTSLGKFNISSTNSDNPADASQENKGGVIVSSGAGIQMKTAGGENESGDFIIDSSWQVKIKTADTFGIDSDNKIQYKAANEIQLKGSKTELQPVADLPAIAPDISVSAPDYVTDIPNNLIANPFISYVKWHKHDNADISKINRVRSEWDLPPIFAIPPTPAIYADRVARIPMHEPWYQHENLNPLEFTPDKTRAGSELKDIYPAQIPDTFATTPAAQGTSSESTLFDPEFHLFTEANGQYTWSTERITQWKNICRDLGLSENFALGVRAVITSQYGKWDYDRTETKPNYGSDEENIIVCRKRYFNLRDKTDEEIVSILSQTTDTEFFENVYGGITAYGRALGNTISNLDGSRFRGHGPYLGIIGRAAQQKAIKWAQSKTAVQFNLTEQQEPTYNLQNLNSFGHDLVLAGWLKNHYKDHGRNMLGNIRITLFGTEDYELNHQRDMYIYRSHVDSKGVRNMEDKR